MGWWHVELGQIKLSFDSDAFLITFHEFSQKRYFNGTNSPQNLSKF